MTVAQITTNPTDLDMIDKINEIIRNLLYVDDSTIKIIGGGGNQYCSTERSCVRAVPGRIGPGRSLRWNMGKHQLPVRRDVLPGRGW